MEPTVATDGPKPPESDAYRNATPEDVKKATQEKESVYSGTIDEIIKSIDEKGQYFGVFGKPVTEGEPDGRLIIFTESVNIPIERYGTTTDVPSFIGLTRDGFISIPTFEGYSSNQNRDGKSSIDEELYKQIDSFYSTTDRTSLDTYPTKDKYTNSQYHRFRRQSGLPDKEDAFLKTPNALQDPSRIIFPDTSSFSVQDRRNIDLPIWPKGSEQQGVKEFDDMETIKQVISTSQEKARSPHEAKAAEAMQDLEQAKDLSSFISNLPPKV